MYYANLHGQVMHAVDTMAINQLQNCSAAVQKRHACNKTQPTATSVQLCAIFPSKIRVQARTTQ